MNKILRYIAIFVLVVAAAGAAYYFLFPKSQDPKALNSALVNVSNDYLSDRDVDVESIQDEGKYFDLIRAFGTYLSEKQEIERKLASETKSLMILLSPNNLTNPTTFEEAVTKNDSYPKLVDDTTNEVNDSMEKYKKSLAELIDHEDKMVPENSVFRKIENVLQIVEAESKVRVALAQYIKALLDFVKSRDGYYKLDSNKLVFTNPQDQEYFDKLYASVYDINKSLEDLLSQERGAFRQTVGGIKTK